MFLDVSTGYTQKDAITLYNTYRRWTQGSAEQPLQEFNPVHGQKCDQRQMNRGQQSLERPQRGNFKE